MDASRTRSVVECRYSTGDASVTGRGFTPGNAIEGIYQGLTFSLVLVLLDEEEALGDGLWVC